MVQSLILPVSFLENSSSDGHMLEAGDCLKGAGKVER